MKKLAIFLISILFIFCGFLIPIKDVSAETQASPLDMYLIAGQSNAVGYSTKGDYSETFENIGYAGAVNHSMSSGKYAAENVDSFSEYKWSITAGLGRSSSHIGPEYGMAKILNAQYNQTKKAFIFKSGAGGTALRDINSGESGVYGNWYPRSLWEKNYTPSMGITQDPTGVQYQLFVENFKCVYNELVENGYAPTIKGMVWMQGCSDLSYPTEYETLLKTFISDIRADLVSITKDEALLKMPFVIGKIATTYGKYNYEKVPAFNVVQQNVANSLVNVETVETSDLIIVNQDGTINGTDAYHFNAKDAVTLGTRFGEKLVQMQQEQSVLIQSQNGEVLYEFCEGDLILTFVPKENHYLASLSINGTDLDISNIAGNTYTIEDVKEIVTKVNAVFSSTVYKISYYPISGKGEYITKPTSVQVGKTLIIKVVPLEGYIVEEVLFNDILMQSIGDNEYQILPQEAGRVRVRFSKIEDVSNNETNNKPSQSTGGKGCRSQMGMASAISVLTFAFYQIVRKKKG